MSRDAAGRAEPCTSSLERAGLDALRQALALSLVTGSASPDAAGHRARHHNSPVLMTDRQKRGRPVGLYAEGLVAPVDESDEQGPGPSGRCSRSAGRASRSAAASPCRCPCSDGSRR